MRIYKICTIILICIASFLLATATNADDPPKSTNDTHKIPDDNLEPKKGDFVPVPIQPGTEFLDPTSATVIQLEPAFDSRQTVVTSTATPGVLPTPVPGKGSFVPLPPQPAKIGLRNPLDPDFDATTVLSDWDQGLSRRSSQLSIAASNLIMFEDFESDFTPGGGWSLSDPTGHYWDDVNCYPLENSGIGSAWAADDLVGDTPCAENYSNNMSSWLTYGPFSLADAQSATLDFYFRLVSESCASITDCDYLFWGASVDGNQFYGERVSGDYTHGPFQNGYNFATLDLADVPTLGNLTGRSQVWIGFYFRSNASVTAQGPFIDYISLWKNTDSRVYLTDENFDVASFPNSRWESFDFGGVGAYWDDVQCYANSGAWSMWPADNGTNSRDVCAGQDYLNNMYSWVVHGPFNLSGASEAWVDFYFRIISESCTPITDCDYLFWGASTDGIDFYGSTIAGTYINGPYYDGYNNNGFNLRRFYLSNVPTLGDLRGEPQVWLAFIFKSDASFTAQGPFIDDIKVIVERSVSNEVFLPMIIKKPQPQLPKTNLYINNQTGKTINSYTVFNPRFNGVIISNIVCKNIPAGATKFNCNASLDTGTYQVVSNNGCTPPVTEGQVTFNVGDDIRIIRCR